MELREGERVERVFHHHPTPFIFILIKVIITFLPFFVGVYLLQNSISIIYFIYSLLFLIFVFVLVLIYQSLIFWLDKLVVTNQRIIYVNWKYLTVRDESEAFLSDIQDIQTHEKGIISYFWIFDYGIFSLETASSHITILFKNAPDPEGIRQYIYHIRKQ